MTKIEIKHTPGPWTACNNGKCKCGMINSKNDHIATIQRKWGDHIQDRFYQYGEIPEEEAQANTRLVTAAPDLLKVCITLLEATSISMPITVRQELTDVVNKACRE